MEEVHWSEYFLKAQYNNYGHLFCLLSKNHVILLTPLEVELWFFVYKKILENVQKKSH